MVPVVSTILSWELKKVRGVSRSSLDIDDLDGRRTAEAIGITVTGGSAGVLLLAKEAGHIAKVQPILDLLLAAILRLAPSVAQKVLQLASER